MKLPKLFIAVVAFSQACPADVIINEFVAASSDRQLVRETGQYPRVGNSVSWQQPDYNDALWKSGNGPFGFGSLGVSLGTNVSTDVQNRTPSLYLRKKFTVTSATASSSNNLQLAIRYNDGFIAYLNGVEIARRNMGNAGMFAYRDQTAFNAQTSTAITTITLNQARNLLVTGENTLSIQVHNQSLIGTNGGTFLLGADLKLGSDTTLSNGNTTWKYFGGNAEPSGGLIDYGLISGNRLTIVPWAKKTFNDSSWQTGIGPVGMERTNPPDFILGVNLAAEMFNITPSVYVRHRFTATAAEASSAFPLSLNADYDDGVIVYLNGTEIYRRNLGTTGIPTDHNVFATTNHNATGDGGGTAPQDETVALAAARDLLTSGENVLSIQLHNNSLTSSDAIARVTLSTTGSSPRTLVTPTAALRYFVGVTEPQTESDSDSEDSGGNDLEAPDSENDWIELKNSGASSVSLAGWHLSDDPANPTLWAFPPGANIPAGGHLVVLATGLDLSPSLDGTTYLHTNFKLSSVGEKIILSRDDTSIADQLTANYPAQNWRHSYGRQSDGNFGYLATATPGAENSGSALIAAPALPVFSTAGGFHPSALSITLSCATPSSTIRYSTDGSDPLNGTLYTGPVSISSNTILRARSFLTGAIPSAPVANTYLIGQSVARRGLPAIILGGDPKLTFYGPNTSGGTSDGEGIFSIKGGFYSGSIWTAGSDTSAFHYPSLRGRSAEKNATLEYFPVTGAPLRTELGIRISGSNYSRPRYVLSDSASSAFDAKNSTRKPSFNIFFRSEFSEKPIDYPFFPGTSVTKFENIRLRAGKNDISNPFIVDELMRRTFIATGQQGSVGTFNTLWINGVYKGYYNMTERLREAFMQQHHKSKELWDVQQVNQFSDGDPIHWNQMWTYLRSTNLSTTAGYAGVHGFLDVDNFIDYLLVNAYGGTWDWPNNNWVAARERSSLGRWRFYMWDAEGAFGQGQGRNTSYNSFTSDLTLTTSEANSTTSKYIPALYTLLKNSPEFRLRFADRAQKQLFNDGALVNSRMTAVFNQLKTEINPIMQDTIGATVNESFHNNWIASTSRRTNLFSQMTSQGLWTSIPAPAANQHGGEIASGFQLTLTGSGGDIYYTTDGSDPRAPGGTPTGTVYSDPITLPKTSQVRARVLSGGTWSPEIAIAFTVPFSRPTFIHSTTGETSKEWTKDINWSTDPAPYPSGAGAEAAIPAAPDARNAELGASVTIGSLVFNQENSAFRSRVRDKGTGRTLTFSSPTGAEIVVNGDGTGYAEMAVVAGTILANDLKLDIQNIFGDPEFGALRLRENWSGPGGITKTGPGIASMTGAGKTFSGFLVVDRGVLDVSESAAPSSSSFVFVRPGGQLRLSSGTEEGDPDRTYTFGGPLVLSGDGRGAEIADGEQNGKLGALRYEPGSGNNRAILTNTIELATDTDIHVAGASNRLTLVAPLTALAQFNLRKSGGGTLVLSGDQSTHSFPITVENGSLEISGTLGSPINLSPTATLRGHGATSAISGEGHVLLPGTMLSAPSSSASSYSIVFGKSGLPIFNDSSASGNSAALLTSAPTGLLSLDIYLTGSGDTFEGGIVVPFSQDLAASLSSATTRVFVPDAMGIQTFEGATYSPLATPWNLTTIPKNLPLAAPFSTSRLLQLRTGSGPATDFTDWRAATFLDPADIADTDISGPLATPFGDGVANLLRYALGVPFGASALQYLPAPARSGETHGLTFPFDPGRDDIIVKVQCTDDLTDWSNATILFDSSAAIPPATDANGNLTILGPASTGGKQFYRLSIMGIPST